MRNRDASLRFKLVTPDNQPALIEPYMGMAGHAVVRRQDGAVFAHVHPMGTISMAAQEFFVKGNPPSRSTSKEPPGVVIGPASAAGPESHNQHTNSGVAGEISFPYAFPQAGSYRIWIQAKSRGRILTGAFDAIVAAGK